MEVNHLCKVILIDRKLDSCYIFITEKYLHFISKFFPGRLCATSGEFYLGTSHSEAMGCLRNYHRSRKDQITLKCLKLLNLQYSKYIANVLSEVPYYATVSKVEEVISDTHTLVNQLMSFVKSIVVDYEQRRFNYSIT